MDVESVSLLTRRHTEPTTLRSVTRRSTLALCAGEEEEISQGVGLGSVVAVIGPYFSSERRGSALLRLALVFALAAGHTALAVLTSYAERDMSTAMATRNQEEFWLALAKFVGIVAVVVPVAGGYYFTVSLSTLRFREWLTRHLVVLRKGRETSGVDNIDQRICEDAASFADRVIDLSLLTFRYTISTISFTVILWKISKVLVLILVLYAAAGTLAVVALFSKQLSRLAYQTSLKEGNLRAGVVRREPLDKFTRILADLVEVLGARISWNTKLEIFTSTYGYLTILIPTLVLSNPYFKNQIELGVITQAAIAFGRVMDAASIVIDNLSSFASLYAESNRLHHLIRTLEKDDK